MYYTMLYEDNEVICLIYLFDVFIYNITKIDCAAYQNIWIRDEYKFIGVYPFFSGCRSILLYRCVGSSVSYIINILPFYLTIAQRCCTCTMIVAHIETYYTLNYDLFGQTFCMINNIYLQRNRS